MPRWFNFKKSTAEDEEETTSQKANAVPRVSLTGNDTYIDMPKPDLMLALSAPEKPFVDKKVKRHSIHGMMEEENVIRPHQEIAQLSLDEKKFLLAVERGDVASTRRMLQRAEETGYININCVDPLGRSALLMAIDNENLEMVELLIEHKVETKDALLHAISEEFVEAVEVLLDHEETIHKRDEPHSWEALPPDTATFTPDITPLILSAHRDNYEIIKILLDRGATLPMPHDVRCGCDECVTSRLEDSLRHSRSRINAYRALASPSLIALSSKDPILTAFELSWELRRLSFMEHEFKLEYLELRKQCQDFATALLDHTRSSYELEVLLNHDPTGPAFEHGERMHLNRLKLAIKLRQKKDTGLYIVDNSPDIKAEHLCAVVAQSRGCKGEIPEWSVNIPEKLSTPPKKSSNYDETPLRIAHITDIHYDPMYLAGSLAVCDTYVCCQSDLGMAENPDQAAGYWGDYRGCDSPLNVIQSAFESMAERGSYDAIYFTGDIISHRMFDTTPERVKEEVHTIHDELRKTFPGTPIFSTYGNHDSHPVNCYAPPSVTDESVSSQWLYDDTADLWGQDADLPEDAKETIRKGGFYSVLLRPGFRVISINGNTGYLFNWWILFENDPLGQLQWLSDELYKAEQNGEMVHLLSHNPSSDGSAFTIWSREYRRVIDRFAHIIKGTFNGHTHQDELILYHSIENPTEPINVAWNGGSVTTISNLNNNYKVFSVDPTNFELLDFEVWSINVTEANLTPELNPVWFKLYSFKEEYGVEDLSPASIRDLAIRMTEDHSIATKYWRNRHRSADTALASGCGDACLKNLVCRMLMSETFDNTQCAEITGNW